MELSDYQRASRATAVYPGAGDNLTYPALGLCGEAGGDLETVITQVQEGLTDEAMQELNARVDLDKKDPATVAKEYLTESGLIAG